MKLTLALFFLAVTAVMQVSCSDDESGVATNQMTVKIDGADWTSAPAAAHILDGKISITGKLHF